MERDNRAVLQGDSGECTIIVINKGELIKKIMHGLGDSFNLMRSWLGHLKLGNHKYKNNLTNIVTISVTIGVTIIVLPLIKP